MDAEKILYTRSSWLSICNQQIMGFNCKLAFVSWVLVGEIASLTAGECHVNPLHAIFFQGEQKHVFTFYVIPPHWYDTGT